MAICVLYAYVHSLSPVFVFHCLSSVFSYIVTFCLFVDVPLCFLGLIIFPLSLCSSVLLCLPLSLLPFLTVSICVFFFPACHIVSFSVLLPLSVCFYTCLPLSSSFSQSLSICLLFIFALCLCPLCLSLSQSLSTSVTSTFFISVFFFLVSLTFSFSFCPSAFCPPISSFSSPSLFASGVFGPHCIEPPHTHAQ